MWHFCRTRFQHYYSVGLGCKKQGIASQRNSTERQRRDALLTRLFKVVAEMTVQLSGATDRLAGSCKLVEEYGPRWYTQPQQRGS
jgi:hypothetical protein